MGSRAVDIARFIATHPLTRDRKLRALARVVHWQIKSRLRSELIVPWIGGMRLAARRGMTGITGNIYAGLHEFNDMAFVAHFLRAGDVFADIGANVGSYTLLASGVCRAQTVAFEPDPGTFAALLRNIAINDLNALVTARNEALGPKPGVAALTLGLDTLNRIVEASAAPTQTVSMETLDRALGTQSPVLLKLDVEGFELSVLRGAERTLADPGLKAIVTEDRSPAVTDLLQRAGFRERRYDPFKRHLGPPAPGAGGNALFARDEPFVQQRLRDAVAIQVLGKSL